MGIKNLNRFLFDNCSKTAISKNHLNNFKNKTLVIDTSIYLYKYASENNLMENMYLLISILKHYNIIPIFIFDGKPPPEKRDLLIKRIIEKKEAEEKYSKLQIKLKSANDNDMKEIMKDMEYLKRQMVRLKEEDIEKVKKLMDVYGVTYYDAPGEADKLCVYLIKIRKAWGCISDDMDMFLYGCPYVLRGVSLLNHTVMLYDTEKILKDLEMTEQQFCEIMVLSGTDYNINSKTSLKETIKWYYKYNKYCSITDKPYGFYVWLIKNTKYITDFNNLLNTYKIFQINNDTELEKWNNIDIVEKTVNQKELKKIMEMEGFVF
jgi:flap endonuclease-1